MGVYDENVDDALIVVYQASGMTMEYLDCSGPEAFSVLIALAAETGRTLSDVASDVVERRIRFGSAN